MLEALGLALLEKWRGSRTAQIPRLKHHFNRVLVEDSTQQKLPKSNHDHFPAHGNLIIRDEEEVPIEELLENQTGDILDLTVTLGEEQHQARLVAIRARKSVAEKSLREAREKAQGRTLSKAQGLRCQWHLVVTNITAGQLKAKEVSELYRCRWNIEIIFRDWKQSANLDKCPQTRLLNPEVSRPDGQLPRRAWRESRSRDLSSHSGSLIGTAGYGTVCPNGVGPVADASQSRGPDSALGATRHRSRFELLHPDRKNKPLKT